MELLELTPPEFGVAAPGIYVLDSDRAAVCAGPFDTVAVALDWIEDHPASSPTGSQRSGAPKWPLSGR